MTMLAIPLQYLWWHYTIAWSEIFSLQRNFLWFVSHFFSLPTVARTLLAPWRRLAEPYPRVWDLPAFLSVLIVNTLMRLVGLLIRLCLLVIGGLVWFGVALIGLLIYPLWLIVPLVILLLLYQGIIYYV